MSENTFGFIGITVALAGITFTLISISLAIDKIRDELKEFNRREREK